MRRGARHKPWNHAWPPTWYLANNRWRISSWNFTVTIFFFVIFYLILQIVLCHRDFHRKIPCQIACMFRIFLYYFRFDSRLHKIQLYCRFIGNFCIHTCDKGGSARVTPLLEGKKVALPPSLNEKLSYPPLKIECTKFFIKMTAENYCFLHD